MIALKDTLPRYFIVGDRPVKVHATRNGGIQCLALDWKTGDLVLEPSYLSRIFFGGGVDVEEVTENDFEGHRSQITAAR